MIETIVPQTSSISAMTHQAVQAAQPAPAIAEPQHPIPEDEGLAILPEAQLLADPSAKEVTGNNGFHHSSFVQAEEDFAPLYAAASSEFYLPDLPDLQPRPNGFEATVEPGQSEERPAPEFAQDPSLNDEGASFEAAGNLTPTVQPEKFIHQEPLPSENGFYAATPADQEISLNPESPMTHFPYLVEDAEHKGLRPKILLGLAGAALLGCLAAGYLFIYKPFFGANEDAPVSKAAIHMTDDKAAAQPLATGLEGSANAKPAGAKDVQAEAKQTDDAKPVDVSSAVADAHSAEFALQAGVFSTEANANNLAEQLKRAGIPSYVAPTKANKFRVLVGRFVSLNEAQKYIPQAQARAGTAGIRLELLACAVNP